MAFDRKSRYLSQVNIPNSAYIDIGLDNHSLDVLCKMVLSRNKLIRRSQLMNIGKLISLIDPAKYMNDPDKVERYNFIRKGIEARLGLNIDDPYMIMSHINGGIISDEIINMDNYEDVPSNEVNFMNNMVAETLQYATVYQSANMLMDVCTRFKTKEYGTKGEIVEEFKDIINKVQNDFRRSRNEDHTDMTFSLREGQFEDCVIETYNRAANPRKKLSTGMQGMNESLGGGFESGRTYIFFGLPGEGKSTVILNLIYQIKKYNKDYQCKDPTKRPCIVLLTMENSVEESIERLFGMATDRNSMIEYDVDSIINMLRTEGELTLSDTNPIDIIIKYKPTNSVDTGYMYTLTDDLEDQGYEVIAFFQDYIGRIRSSQRLADTRLEYGAVTDDFKTFAQFKDIPVISVSQLNRDASKRIDDGRQSSKTDLVRALGRSNISESMLVLNNIDGGFMITPEYTSDGQRYLGMLRVKIRYNAGDLDVFYLPFSNGNNIKLLEDVGREPIYKTTLRTQMNGIPTVPSCINQPVDIESIRPNNPESIFSTKVNTQKENSISDLDVAFCVPNYNMVSIDPLVFYDKVEIDPLVFY